MRKFFSLPEMAADKIDLPGEIVPGVPKITLTGRRRVHIENHAGILKYSHELIEVDGRRAKIIVRGDDLELVAMNRQNVIISGKILSAEYE